jgi:hypothetical protein
MKEQVKVAAHTSAGVRWNEQGCLLMFTKHSVFAGRTLQVKRQWAYQMVLPFAKSYFFNVLSGLTYDCTKLVSIQQPS